MNRKVGATIVVLVGVALIALTLGAGLFSVGPAFEELTDGFRPVMTQSHLNALGRDIDGVAVAAQDFQARILPAAAQQAGTTPDKLAKQLAVAYPAVFKGITETPAITTQFRGVVGLLSAERARFEKADAIPTSNLPATTVPWSLLGVGIVFVGIGALMTRPGRARTGVALVLGVLVVAVAFVFTLPDKASAADTMNDHLKPVYTKEFVAGAQTSLATITAMGNELGSKMLPAFAQQAGVTVQQYQQQLAAAAPGLADAIQGMPAAIERFTTTLQVFDENLANYDTIKPVTLGPIVWALIAGGAVVFLAAAVVLTWRPRVDVEVIRLDFRKAA